MKKLTQLFFILLFSYPTFASHFVGGEITWECLSNGKYVFSMNLYRDCSGIPASFINEIVYISGNPLPLNGITSIVLEPDSARFASTNNGDLSAYCSSSYSAQPSCVAGSPGVIQLLPYKSDPIQLTGTPPSSGWSFTFTSACCIASKLQNVNASGAGILRSVLFPLNNRRVDTCYSSSPQFVEIASGRFCRGELVEYSHKAISKEGDSLAYSSVPLLSGNATNPTMVSYKPGYSASSPTSNSSYNSNNVAYTLNAQNGDVKFAIYNGTHDERYALNTRVVSSRKNSITAIVDRTYPLTISDCTPMPSGYKNTAPNMQAPFNLNGNPSFDTAVVVGSNLSFVIDIADTNTTGVGNGQQEFTISPISSSLSRNFYLSTNCYNPNDTSCATLGFMPTWDANQIPPRYVYKAMRSALLFFNWQTDCNHLSFQGNSKTHYFTFKISDDHCPIPKVTYKTVSITVLPSATYCNLSTGLEDSQIDPNSKISVYPNPTTNLFTLSGLKTNDYYRLEIRNVQGQLVSEESFVTDRRKSIHLEGEQGIYFLQLTDGKGKRTNLKVLKN